MLRTRLALALLITCASSNALALQTAGFTARWGQLERCWIGPEYFANRYQDWRLRNGRVECIEARASLPMRTLHLLTHSLADADGRARLHVATGPLSTASTRGRRGFLIGSGGRDADYRRSALTHHQPAEDGGLLCVVDAAGQVRLHDFSTPGDSGGLWSLAGELGEEAIPELSMEGRAVPTDAVVRDLVLELQITAAHGTCQLEAIARDRASGTELSRARARDVALDRVAGSVALVSDQGGSSGGFWFEDWTAEGTLLQSHPDRLFGPILCTQHTLSQGTLKLTAQMGPLGEADTQQARLEIRPEGAGTWTSAASASLHPWSNTFTFRVDDWDGDRAVEYRVVYELARGQGDPDMHEYRGTIRAIPSHQDELVIAAFTGHKVYTGGLRWNRRGLWFPHEELVAAVEQHRPDFLFFSGDQIYEGDLTPAERSTDEAVMRDYLYKFSRWCWAFRDLLRDIPAVTIPDDHDVYHGNIWGAGGRKAEARDGLTAQDAGGYRLAPHLVNAIHRTQVSHLPDPVDPAPIEQGISVYHTRVEYAGVSFAVLADRMWKSSPSVLVPAGRFVNGFSQAPDFRPALDSDVEGAILLGDRQLRFLREWATDWSFHAFQKVVLSQTLFANLATLPAGSASDAVTPALPVVLPGEYPPDDLPVADADSNGWPRSGRDRALREMRRGFAIHIAGDQHLGSTVQYGVDTWGDAGFALCVPSIANTWPRRWYPRDEGRNTSPGQPRYAGDFRDGFGNHITVRAVSNPVHTGQEPARLHDRAPGYGIVRLHRNRREIQFENWPRWVDPSAKDAAPYAGWPVRIHPLENYSRTAGGWLPRVEVIGLSEPVFQVIDEATTEVVYALRPGGNQFHPWVFDDGRYTLCVGDPDADRLQQATGLRPVPDPADAAPLTIRF